MHGLSLRCSWRTPPGKKCALTPSNASHTSHTTSAPNISVIRVRDAVEFRRLQLLGNEEMANDFSSSIVCTAFVRGRAQGNISTDTRTLQSSTVLGSIPRPPSTSPRLPRILMLLFLARSPGLGSWVGPDFGNSTRQPLGNQKLLNPDRAGSEGGDREGSGPLLMQCTVVMRVPASGIKARYSRQGHKI